MPTRKLHQVPTNFCLKITLTLCNNILLNFQQLLEHRQLEVDHTQELRIVITFLFFLLESKRD